MRFWIVLIFFAVFATTQVSSNEKTVADMVREHNTVENWAFSIPSKHPFYTSDMETALIRSDHRPLLIRGSIDDVKRNSDSSYMVSIYDHLEPGSRIFRYEITCDEKILAPLLERRPSHFATVYAVVDVSSVKQLEEKPDDPINGQWLATGTCKDILFPKQIAAIVSVEDPPTQTKLIAVRIGFCVLAAIVLMWSWRRARTT